jgi:hypothetical protein
MKLADFIKQLQEIKKEYGGDIEVNYEGIELVGEERRINEIYLEIEDVEYKDSWLVDWINWD